jgi:hypothetical protein
MPALAATRPVLVALLTLALAGCAAPIPATGTAVPRQAAATAVPGRAPVTGAQAPTTALPPLSVPAVAPVKPLPGSLLAPPATFLLQPADLPAGFQPEQGPADPTDAPGLVSSTERFVHGSGPNALHLYVRLSVFDSVTQVATEFNAEQGDISRSATALPANGQTLGNAWLGYTVDSGAGQTAQTSSVGVLFRERNFLGSLVLTGPRGGVQLSELWPLAQEQVNRVALARSPAN